MKCFLISILLCFYHFIIVANGIVFNGQLSQDAEQWADSVYLTLDLELKVAQVLMVRMAHENITKQLGRDIPPPGFIIGESLFLKKQPSSSDFPLATFYVVDIRAGFEGERMPLPFPDEKTFSILEPVHQQNMVEWLVSQYKEESNTLFLNSHEYRHFWMPEASKKPNSGSAGFRIWLPASRPSRLSDQSLLIHAQNIPDQINRLLPSRLPRIKVQSDSGHTGAMISVTTENRLPLTSLSIEQVLAEGSLLVTDNYAKDYERLVNAFKKRWLKEEMLEKACKSVLAFKYVAATRSLMQWESKSETEVKLQFRAAYENSISVFQPSNKHLLPLNDLNRNVGYYNLGAIHINSFKRLANNYIEPPVSDLPPESYDLIFLMADPSFHWGMTFKEGLKILRDRYPNANIVFIWAGNPSQLPFKTWPDELDAMVAVPANIPFCWQTMAQVVFNGIKTSIRPLEQVFGKYLTVYQKSFPATRLKYGIPEEVGLNVDTLYLIGEVIGEAIKQQATPGAQLLIARKGVVVVNQSYGWHTYKKDRFVVNSDIYDLASLTKITSTLPLALKTYDESKWRLGDRLGAYLPEADTTDKRDISIRELLLHESGLPSFIPFHMETIDRSKLDGSMYSRRKSHAHPYRVDERLYMNRTTVWRDDVYQSISDLQFSVPVAPNLYLNHTYLDSMYHRILNVKRHTRGYVYSDLNFLLLQRMQERLTGQSMDQSVTQYFYKPLGAGSLSFNPWRTGRLDHVVPTENDPVFRRQLLKGYVHDQTAAMMGGVAGHAGLFGNANDLAKLMQMYLNGGEYGGRRFINPETIYFFSSQQNPENRRGLGFDKPEMDTEKDTPVSRMASELSFGHSGFTGTIVWVDPTYDLIYIFLSNRIHPNQYNRKLIETNVRTDIQEIIYRAIEDRPGSED
jgi:CubicO group peptidase (beta-lactamase class C family)